ncbi:MAG: hypothetical protein LBI96_03885 [Odoribacteraceae bacterium]|jgi:hypothetical protein|nr:hypothetical protein [Odoribacteraceae bacterium]
MRNTKETNEPDSIPQQDLTTSIDGHSTTTLQRTYQAWGVHQAGLVDGDPNALHSCLEATHISARKTVAENAQLQNNRKTKLQNKIDILDGEVTDYSNKIVGEQGKLTFEEGKIEKLKNEINDWTLRPQEMLKRLGKDAYNKLTFWSSGIILIFLTIYLFIFYSSASYSAFFKKFTADDSDVANSIFDAKAFANAFQDGFTALLFISFFVVLGLALGLIFDYFLKKKGNIKYWAIPVVIVAFILDFFIAYEIVEKIYNIKKEGSFVIMPDITIDMALQQVNFWLIIFAGFVAYIIWGIIYYVFGREHEKFDAVKYNIKKREEKIEEYKDECKKIKDKIQELETDKTATLSRIKILKNELSGIIVLVSDVKQYIGEFFVGWLSVMNGNGKSRTDIEKCKEIKENFIDDLHKNAFYTNVSN